MRTMRKVFWACLTTILGLAAIASGAAPADQERPGQFRPQPILSPDTHNVGATGMKVQPLDTLPKSLAPLGSAVRKPKRTERGRPTPRGTNELVLDAGWELIEAPRLQAPERASAAAGGRLSRPGLDTQAWYDATVPGTVLTTLVEQGVYPDP